MTQPDEFLTLNTVDQQIAHIEAQISHLNTSLEDAKKTVQEWVNANSSLSQSAAEARAETQSMGRGLGGALFGSKYRAASRNHAASINAQIARKVVSKKAQIKQGKQDAQELVGLIQAQISQLKDELKLLKSERKAISSAKKSTQSVQVSSRSLILLEKLSEAYQMGLLTQEEYEEKRKKIVDQI